MNIGKHREYTIYKQYQKNIIYFLIMFAKICKFDMQYKIIYFRKLNYDKVIIKVWHY